MKNNRDNKKNQINGHDRDKKRRAQGPRELQVQQQQQEIKPQRIRLPSKTWSELDFEREYYYSHGYEDYMEDYSTPY